MTVITPNHGEFTQAEWQQYSRQIQLSQFGPSGQIKLKRSRILIVGAGGLGSPTSLYLTAAGIGKITIIDHDKIECSNLQRQVIYNHQQKGTLKAVAAKETLQKLNPHIEIRAVAERFSPKNAAHLVQAHDLILDCSDNFATRYLINDTCFHQKKPWIFASVQQFEGQCALFQPHSACFRCVFPQPPNDAQDCSNAGVLGVVPGILGLHQANEAIKYLSGFTETLDNQLLLIDTLALSIRKIRLIKNEHCVLCGQKKNAIDPSLYNPHSSQKNTKDLDSISHQECDRLLTQEDVTFLDIRSNDERQAFHIGGTHIPLSELHTRLNELTTFSHVICYCQSGTRSQKAAQLINATGKLKAFSLSGGLASYVGTN